MLGDNIRAERARHKLSQKELADKIGVNRVTIVSYEKGDTDPPSKILKKLSQALNITTDELLREKLPFEE